MIANAIFMGFGDGFGKILLAVGVAEGNETVRAMDAVAPVYPEVNRFGAEGDASSG